jgi:hypothetical protein
MTNGSYLEFTVPWVTEETGFVTKINAQLMNLETTTSLLYRPFIKCETLQVGNSIEYRGVSECWLINPKILYFPPLNKPMLHKYFPLSKVKSAIISQILNI